MNINWFCHQVPSLVIVHSYAITNSGWIQTVPWCQRQIKNCTKFYPNIVHSVGPQRNSKLLPKRLVTFITWSGNIRNGHNNWAPRPTNYRNISVCKSTNVNWNRLSSDFLNPISNKTAIIIIIIEKRNPIKWLLITLRLVLVRWTNNLLLILLFKWNKCCACIIYESNGTNA